MLIKIKFFGELKDKVKKSSIELNIDAEYLTKRELFPILEKNFKISEEEIFNIAINNSLSENSLKDGDTVSLHPIYRGG